MKKDYGKVNSFRLDKETEKKIEEMAKNSGLTKAKVITTLVKNAKIKVEVSEE